MDGGPFAVEEVEVEEVAELGGEDEDDDDKAHDPEGLLHGVPRPAQVAEVVDGGLVRPVLQRPISAPAQAAVPPAPAGGCERGGEEK